MKYAKLVNNRLVSISNYPSKNLKQVIDNATEYDSKTQQLTSQYFEEDENYIYRKFHVKDKVIAEPDKQVMLTDLSEHVYNVFNSYAKHINSDTPKSQALALKIRGFLKQMHKKITKSYENYNQADYQNIDLFLSALEKHVNDIDVEFELKELDVELLDIIEQDKGLSPHGFLEDVIEYGNVISNKEVTNERRQ